MKYFLYPLFLIFLSNTIKAKELAFMSYNVENLFDTKHDIENGIDKNDWSYLPYSFKNKKNKCNEIRSFYRRRECHSINWTQEKLLLKINQIKKVILQNNKRPDFIALTEVENSNVVAMLTKSLGYQSFLITKSLDTRGIDVALIYKTRSDVKFIAKKEHVLKGKYFKKRASRNILEVEFLINKKYPLTIFVNHWPSLSNPNKTRIIAANTLKEKISTLLIKNKKHAVIALGDFNTISKNRPHPFLDILLKDLALSDLHQKFMKSRRVSRQLKKTFPLGTYFYPKNMSWNHLDRVFYTNNLKRKKRLQIILNSYRIISSKFMTKKYEYKNREDYLYGTKVMGVPYSYDFHSKQLKNLGHSDHFPLVFKLQY